MPVSIVEVPSATIFLSTAGSWSEPLFTAFVPWIFALIGIAVGILLVAGILNMFLGIFEHFSENVYIKIRSLFEKKYKIVGLGPRSYPKRTNVRIVDKFSGDVVDEYDEPNYD